MLKNFEEFRRFGQMYIITNMGIHKVMGTNYRYQHIIHVYTVCIKICTYIHSYKSYTSVRNKFSTLNKDKN